MLTPYDLGSFQIADNCLKIKVDDLVRKAQQGLKIRLLEAQTEALGVTVSFTISKTKFNGKRIWFVCPNCKRRVGTIYKHSTQEIVGCRICLSLRYKKQRFKGMIESS